MPSSEPNGRSAAKVLVVGHICLDIIPAMRSAAAAIEPGKLVEVGPALISTGGAVSNVGLTLHRLGVPVHVLGRTGDDLFADAISDRFRAAGLSAELIRDAALATSYSIVINPPGADRSFLHCAGANDSFDPDDVDPTRYPAAKLLHFGYPQIMSGVARDGGTKLASLLQHAHQHGMVTSLDTAFPDPSSTAGRIDWLAFFERVLPHVDVFTPSFDEFCLMLGQTNQLSLKQLRANADRALVMGARVVLQKLGDQGLYASTTQRPSDLNHFARVLGVSGENWCRQEHAVPCFRADVQGTTGAGDATVAGFLAAILQARRLPEALNFATGVGACCVEAVDAVSGIRSAGEVQLRIDAGWPRLQQRIAALGDDDSTA